MAHCGQRRGCWYVMNCESLIVGDLFENCKCSSRTLESSHNWGRMRASGLPHLYPVYVPHRSVAILLPAFAYQHDDSQSCHMYGSVLNMQETSPSGPASRVRKFELTETKPGSFVTSKSTSLQIFRLLPSAPCGPVDPGNIEDPLVGEGLYLCLCQCLATDVNCNLISYSLSLPGRKLESLVAYRITPNPKSWA